MTAVVRMATPCTKSLGGRRRGHKHGGDEGRKLFYKLATVSWLGEREIREAMRHLRYDRHFRQRRWKLYRNGGAYAWRR